METQILAIYAGSARYCNECGNLRNENDFTSRTLSRDPSLTPGGPVIVPCDYCREEARVRARPKRR